MLDSEYVYLNAEVQKLLYEKAQIANRQKSLAADITADKEWLVEHPQRQDFVEKLQTYLQQQNVAAFNHMLTAFVEDVLQKDKQIELELYTSHSLPALKIHAVNEGLPESIMEGSGGSLANIVSTGLRVIAAARSPARNFLVLDEADCWIKPERIELFAKVIGEISVKLNMQIVMISHHSAKHFENYGRVIEIKKNGSKIEAVIVSDTPYDITNTQYISQMRLQNFMSHEDTTIDFHPNITCIIGENDIGKSVVAAAFRATARNHSEDAFIKHHKDFARVTTTVDADYQVMWQRNRKTTQEHKQKVYYELIHHDTPILQEYNSHDCPKEVAQCLNIEEIDNIDVHLAHQKEPTFLIDSKTRPQDKAKILSLGKESFIVQKMMEKIKEKAKITKDRLKVMERDYYTNSRIEEAIGDTDLLTGQLDVIKEAQLQQVKIEADLVKLNLHIKSLEENLLLSATERIVYAENYQLHNTQLLEHLSDQMTVLVPLSALDKVEASGTIPDITDTSRMTKAIEKIGSLEIISKMDSIELQASVPDLSDTKRLDTAIRIIQNASNLALVDKITTLNALEDTHLTQSITSILSMVESLQKLVELSIVQPAVIDVHTDTEHLVQLLQQITDTDARSVSLHAKREVVEESQLELSRRQKELYDQLEGVCPCCGSKVDCTQLF